MIITREWVVPVEREKAWDRLTNFSVLAELAHLTDDFVIDGNIVEGASFSETHYFLGKRRFTGTFTMFRKPLTWELESDPKEGTGFPVYHKVTYVLTDVPRGTRVICVADYKTNWKFGEYIDYLLFPFVYLFIVDMHRKMRKECLRS